MDKTTKTDSDEKGSGGQAGDKKTMDSQKWNGVSDILFNKFDKEFHICSGQGCSICGQHTFNYRVAQERINRFNN